MKRYLFALMLLGASLLGGCAPKESKDDKHKPLVIVSIPPYISLVKAIAGDTVSIVSAVPPNFDPHTMEVTPRQWELVQGASLFVAIGETYEKKLLQTLLDEQKDLQVLYLNAKTPLIPYSHDSHCPDACHSHSHSTKEAQDIHFWLSPKSLEIQLKVLTQSLIKICPDLEETYNKNAASYVEKIQRLDHDIQVMLKPYQGKGIIVSHAALGYFCHDYHLIQIPVECEGKSPLPQDINRALDLVARTDIACVFIAPQYNNKGAEKIAEELKLRTYTFDPLSEDLLKTLEQIAKDITN